jgi:FtsZ-binding cell division protein ZapB
MSEKRFSETERNCYYTSLVFDNQTQEKLGTTKVVELLNEQQATIRRLQDLCGKSDGENSHLRIENKRLQYEIDELKKDIDIYEYEEKKHSETVRKLQEENEQLRKELNDCEKFRYQVFKRMGDVLDE